MAATPTTVAGRLPPVHLPSGLALEVLAAAALAVAVAVWAHHRQQRTAQRARILEGLLEETAAILRTRVWPSHVNWQHLTPVRLVARYAATIHDDPDTLKRLERHLSDRLAAQVHITPDRRRRILTITAGPLPALLPTLIRRPDLPPRTAGYPFGQAADGTTVTWNPDAGTSAPHCLIGAPTGRGKTQLLTTLIAAAVAQRTDVRALDGKIFGLMDVRHLVTVYAHQPVAFADAISDVYHENERRKHAVLASGDRATARTFPPIMLVVDEFADVIAGLRKIRRDDTVEQLESLVQTGRETRIIVCLATLRPDVDEKGITGRARGQLGCRILLGRSEDLAMHTMMFRGRAPDPTVDTPGRGILRGPDGRYVEFQAWLTPIGAPPAVKPAVKAAANGAVKPQVKAAVKGLPEALPEDTVRRIQELRREGMSMPKIAAEVGVSVGAVHKYSKRPALHLVKDD